MQLVQHEQMWAMSRNIQAELLREAEKVRMLRQSHAPRKPWWDKFIRQWQASDKTTMQARVTPELG